MLDNIDGPELQDVARRLKKRWSGKRKFLLESSGNITESNLNYRAVEGALVRPLFSGFVVLFECRRSCLRLALNAEIDILSTSAVHQSVQHIDFSLKIQMPKTT